MCVLWVGWESGAGGGLEERWSCPSDKAHSTLPMGTSLWVLEANFLVVALTTGQEVTINDPLKALRRMVNGIERPSVKEVAFAWTLKISALVTAEVWLLYHLCSLRVAVDLIHVAGDTADGVSDVIAKGKESLSAVDWE